MSRKMWQVAACNKELARRLADECGIDLLVALILTGRGCTDSFEIEELLSDDQPLGDPYELPDMDKAVECIEAAIHLHRRIAVYGDYDADGVTSTAMMYSYLVSRGADVMYYVPERDEGYGMNKAAVDSLHSDGVKLIITVDNGIMAFDEIEYASQLGIDTVVTDHHLPGDTLPSAVAVVDPHRRDCDITFRNYSGAGVAFKVICAMENSDGSEIYGRYGDLAAVGTIADVMPLTGENRTIVKNGLRYIAGGRVGITELIRAAGLDRRPMSSGSVSFGIAPRLNAAGRVGKCIRAVRLLLENDRADAAQLADEINADNVSRQSIERAITDEAVAIIEQNGLMYDRVIVVDGTGWHHGVIGIVAARICERYGRPTVVLCHEDGVASGSARSVGNFSIYEAITACDRLLTRYGGHEQAAGVTLPSDSVGEFRRRINQYAAERYDDMPFDIIHIDCKLSLSAFTVNMVESLDVLAPFGAGNRSPVFGMFGVRLERITAVGDGKHLRLEVSKNGLSATVMYFSHSEASFGYRAGMMLDLAVAADISEYAGRKQVTLNVKAARLSGYDDDIILSDIRLYERIRRGEPLSCEQASRAAVCREGVAAVYRAVRGGFAGEDEALRATLPQLSLLNVNMALDVLSEIGVINLTRRGSVLTVRPVSVSGKMELTASDTFRKFAKGV